MIDNQVLVLIINLWYVTLALGAIAAGVVVILAKKSRKAKKS